MTSLSYLIMKSTPLPSPLPPLPPPPSPVAEEGQTTTRNNNSRHLMSSSSPTTSLSSSSSSPYGNATRITAVHHHQEPNYSFEESDDNGSSSSSFQQQQPPPQQEQPYLLGTMMNHKYSTDMILQQQHQQWSQQNQNYTQHQDPHHHHNHHPHQYPLPPRRPPRITVPPLATPNSSHERKQPSKPPKPLLQRGVSTSSSSSLSSSFRKLFSSSSRRVSSSSSSITKQPKQPKPINNNDKPFITKVGMVDCSVWVPPPLEYETIKEPSLLFGTTTSTVKQPTIPTTAQVQCGIYIPPKPLQAQQEQPQQEEQEGGVNTTNMSTSTSTRTRTSSTAQQPSQPVLSLSSSSFSSSSPHDVGIGQPVPPTPSFRGERKNQSGKQPPPAVITPLPKTTSGTSTTLGTTPTTTTTTTSTTPSHSSHDTTTTSTTNHVVVNNGNDNDSPIRIPQRKVSYSSSQSATELYTSFQRKSSIYLVQQQDQQDQHHQDQHQDQHHHHQPTLIDDSCSVSSLSYGGTMMKSNNNNTYGGDGSSTTTTKNNSYPSLPSSYNYSNTSSSIFTTTSQQQQQQRGIISSSSLGDGGIDEDSLSSSSMIIPISVPTTSMHDLLQESGFLQSMGSSSSSSISGPGYVMEDGSSPSILQAFLPPNNTSSLSSISSRPGYVMEEDESSPSILLGPSGYVMNGSSSSSSILGPGYVYDASSTSILGPGYVEDDDDDEDDKQKEEENNDNKNEKIDEREMSILSAELVQSIGIHNNNNNNNDEMSILSAQMVQSIGIHSLADGTYYSSGGDDDDDEDGTSRQNIGVSSSSLEFSVSSILSSQQQQQQQQQQGSRPQVMMLQKKDRSLSKMVDLVLTNSVKDLFQNEEEEEDAEVEVDVEPPPSPLTTAQPSQQRDLDKTESVTEHHSNSFKSLSSPPPSPPPPSSSLTDTGLPSSTLLSPSSSSSSQHHTEQQQQQQQLLHELENTRSISQIVDQVLSNTMRDLLSMDGQELLYRTGRGGYGAELANGIPGHYCGIHDPVVGSSMPTTIEEDEELSEEKEKGSIVAATQMTEDSSMGNLTTMQKTDEEEKKIERMEDSDHPEAPEISHQVLCISTDVTGTPDLATSAAAAATTAKAATAKVVPTTPWFPPNLYPDMPMEMILGASQHSSSGASTPHGTADSGANKNPADGPRRRPLPPTGFSTSDISQDSTIFDDSIISPRDDKSNLPPSRKLSMVSVASSIQSSESPSSQLEHKVAISTPSQHSTNHSVEPSSSATSQEYATNDLPMSSDPTRTSTVNTDTAHSKGNTGKSWNGPAPLVASSASSQNRPGFPRRAFSSKATSICSMTVDEEQPVEYEYPMSTRSGPQVRGHQQQEGQLSPPISPSIDVSPKQPSRMLSQLSRDSTIASEYRSEDSSQSSYYDERHSSGDDGSSEYSRSFHEVRAEDVPQFNPTADASPPPSQPFRVQPKISALSEASSLPYDDQAREVSFDVEGTPTTSSLPYHDQAREVSFNVEGTPTTCNSHKRIAFSDSRQRASDLTSASNIMSEYHSLVSSACGSYSGTSSQASSTTRSSISTFREVPLYQVAQFDAALLMPPSAWDAVDTTMDTPMTCNSRKQQPNYYYGSRHSWSGLTVSSSIQSDFRSEDSSYQSQNYYDSTSRSSSGTSFSETPVDQVTQFDPTALAPAIPEIDQTTLTCNGHKRSTCQPSILSQASGASTLSSSQDNSTSMEASENSKKLHGSATLNESITTDSDTRSKERHPLQFHIQNVPERGAQIALETPPEQAGISSQPQPANSSTFVPTSIYRRLDSVQTYQSMVSDVTVPWALKSPVKGPRGVSDMTVPWALKSPMKGPRGVFRVGSPTPSLSSIESLGIVPPLRMVPPSPSIGSLSPAQAAPRRVARPDLTQPQEETRSGPESPTGQISVSISQTSGESLISEAKDGDQPQTSKPEDPLVSSHQQQKPPGETAQANNSSAFVPRSVGRLDSLQSCQSMMSEVTMPWDLHSRMGPRGLFRSGSPSHSISSNDSFGTVPPLRALRPSYSITPASPKPDLPSSRHRVATSSSSGSEPPLLMSRPGGSVNSWSPEPNPPLRVPRPTDSLTPASPGLDIPTLPLHPKDQQKQEQVEQELEGPRDHDRQESSRSSQKTANSRVLPPGLHYFPPPQPNGSDKRLGKEGRLKVPKPMRSVSGSKIPPLMIPTPPQPNSPSFNSRCSNAASRCESPGLPSTGVALRKSSFFGSSHSRTSNQQLIPDLPFGDEEGEVQTRFPQTATAEESMPTKEGGGDDDRHDDGVVSVISSVKESSFLVKHCPQQICYLYDGLAFVREGFYSGSLDRDGYMHGSGVFWFAQTNDLYLGQFHHGEIHGIGALSISSSNRAGGGRDESQKKQILKGYWEHNEFVGEEMIFDVTNIMWALTTEHEDIKDCLHTMAKLSRQELTSSAYR